MADHRTPALDNDSTDAPTPRTRNRARLSRRIAVVNGAAVAVAILVFLSTRPLGSGAAGPTPDPGASFYVLGSGTGGLDVGRPAPDFVGQTNGQPVRLTDLDGREVALDDLRGRPVWVVFWATWCPPCQRETPDLRATDEAHKSDGLALIAIDLEEPADVVRTYVETFGLEYTIGLDQTGAVGETYGVFGLPTHYFIDRQGVIRGRNLGPLTRDQMEQRVDFIETP